MSSENMFHKYFMYRGGSISCADIFFSGTYFSKYPPFSSHAHATPFLQVRYPCIAHPSEVLPFDLGTWHGVGRMVLTTTCFEDCSMYFL